MKPTDHTAGKPINAEALRKEMAAAGLPDLLVAWSPDGRVKLSSSTTPAQLDTFETVAAAHDAAARDAEDAEHERIAAIKEKCRVTILAVIPEWKQNNWNARQNELNKVRADRMAAGVPAIGIGGDFWDDAERAEVEQMNTLWTWVKTVRAESDAAELAGKTAAQTSFTPWK